LATCCCGGATERLMELLHAESDIVSAARPVLCRPDAARAPLRSGDFQLPIGGQTRRALREFSLDVRPGETVCTGGSSGAARARCCNCCCATTTAKGRILIRRCAAGIARARRPAHAIGLVPQDAVIFSSSAMENIRYGRPDASDADVRTAAKALCRRLSHGLPDVMTLPRRARSSLSAANRQRIAIARAILKNAPLLLLD